MCFFTGLRGVMQPDYSTAEATIPTDIAPVN